MTEGRNRTAIPYIDIHRHSTAEVGMPDTPNPFVWVVVDGVMRLRSDDDFEDFHAGRFLAPPISKPVSAQALSVSEESPFLALSIVFCVEDVISVMLDIDGDLPERLSDARNLPGTGEPGRLLAIVFRLLEMSGKPDQLAFMLRHLKRELIFEILLSRCGKPFIERTVNIRQSGDIYFINSWIKENYRDDFSVRELAEKTGMSVSGFHQKFKSAIGMGPVQCRKKLRLNEARRLMLDLSVNVTEAALEVGYESLSQFTRDYRRMFGRSPQKDMQEIRDYLVTRAQSG